MDKEVFFFVFAFPPMLRTDLGDRWSCYTERSPCVVTTAIPGQAAKSEGAEDCRQFLINNAVSSAVNFETRVLKGVCFQGKQHHITRSLKWLELSA